MELSVVIPTYNRRGSLRECLCSLLVQDYPRRDYEIIVIDDGSTDGTPHLLSLLKKNHKNHHLVCLRQKHSGVSCASNLGIKSAQGELIAFTEDDCIIPKDWIKKIVDYHSRYPEIIAIQGKVLNFYKDNLIANLEQETFDAYRRQITYRIGEKKFINILASGNCSFKSKAFKDYGIYFREHLFSEDADLSKQLIAKGQRILYAGDTAVLHKHRNTFTSFIRKSFRDERGKFMLDTIWGKNRFNQREFLSSSFFIKMVKVYLTKYRLKGLLMIFLHLIRKITRILGYFYQKSISRNESF